MDHIYILESKSSYIGWYLSFETQSIPIYMQCIIDLYIDKSIARDLGSYYLKLKVALWVGLWVCACVRVSHFF